MCSLRIIWWQRRRHTYVHRVREHVSSSQLSRGGRKEGRGGGKKVIHNREYSHHHWAIFVGIFEELLDECAIADLSWSRPYCPCRMSIFWKES